MSEHLRIAYKLVGAGWSECVVEAGGGRADVTASYLSDALGNLVLSAIAVASGFQAVAFEFTEEPGEYRWVLDAKQNNVVRLRILEFPQLWSFEPNEKGRCMLEVQTTPLLFAKAVYACAANVLQEFGVKGYAEKWINHPFPDHELALLGDVISRWSATRDAQPLRPTYTLLVVLDSPMARLIASWQRPGRPSDGCIGVARHAPRVQPTALQGAGRLSSRSHLV